ncbi:MAG: hypothetical protein ISS48_03345 [Candidatus Aenigmarchaeota archaeon]|nr:hypothetical protein [Candidatus Aenigmarchaeota archaeon]
MVLKIEMQVPIKIEKKIITVINEKSVMSKVNELLALEYGSVYVAGLPELIRAIDSILWKIPVFYATRKKGIKKKVGDFFIDAKTGEIVSIPSIESLRSAV